MWVRCCLTWGDRNWGTWARRLGWDELRGCTGGCCGCCMVLACAAPLLPNIPRLPLGICSRTVTQALNGTPQHITRVFLVCAGIILSDYERHESRVYWKPGLESGRAKAAMYPTSQTPQTLYSCQQKAAEVEDGFCKDAEPWRVTRWTIESTWQKCSYLYSRRQENGDIKLTVTPSSSWLSTFFT